MFNFRGLIKVKLLKKEGAIRFFNYDSLLFPIFFIRHSFRRSFPFIAIATLDFFDSSGHTFQYHFHSICHIFEHKNQWLAELNNEINVHVKTLIRLIFSSFPIYAFNTVLLRF